jgi:phosphate starvation-inducible protein PhoH
MPRKNSESKNNSQESGKKNSIAPTQNLLSKIKIDIKCKTENQKKLVNLIKDKEITICCGLAGCGKAQPLDSLVLTPNGYVKMGSLKINDDVIGVDGLPIKVIGVFPQGEKDIYEITFSDGTSTECCGEHLWLTQTYNDRNYVKKIRNKNGARTKIGNKGREGTVKSTLEIMETLKIGVKSIKTNHSIPTVKPISFEKKDTNIDPYLLGCLLGDGGFTTARLSFTTSDTEILTEIKKILPKDHIIEEKYSQNYTIKSIGIRDNDITNYLKKVDLFGLKSDEKFIPKEFLFNDIETRLEILRGLMDTDGTVIKKAGTPIFYSTSLKLIEDVTFLVQSLGGIVIKNEKIGKYKKPNGEIKICKKIYSLHINLPNEFIPFKLPRKINLLKERTKYLPIRYITDIKLIGKKEAQCIQVNDEKHLYLTNDCIVTHNTFLACYQALNLLKTQPDKYKKIVLVKSVTTLKEEEIGFLKGSLEEKMEPFVYSFMNNFEKIIGRVETAVLRQEGIIEVMPIAYMRGINIDEAIIIIDEVQNITIKNIRTILTRIGFNSKMIFLGDTKQIDYKNQKDSALKFIMEQFNHLEEIGTIELGEEDVVRNPLIKKIENVFNKIESNPPQQ